MFDEAGLDHTVNLFHVPSMQGYKNGAFVREVLVYGADAYPRYFRDMVCCDGTKTFAFQNSNHRIEDCLDRLARSPLFRFAPAIRLFGCCFHRSKSTLNVSRYIYSSHYFVKSLHQRHDVNASRQVHSRVLISDQ